MVKRYKVAAIICVHNALEDVKNCISSVMQTSTSNISFEIIIIDDGSKAPTSNYLKKLVKETPFKNIKLIRREEAGGYTVAANTGLKSTEADFYALLNSDTIVPKFWIEKIVSIFSNYTDVGIIGPLSNAASWQSVPERSNPNGGWAVNELPKGFDVNMMDKVVEDCMTKDVTFPRVPLLNGFCYVIKSDVIKKIGHLDEIGFPRGFGEEDDYSLRAADAGFGLMVALNTYVYHAKSKSYGSAKRNELSKLGQLTLKRKHSEQRLKRSTDTMKINPYLEKMRINISTRINRI